MLAEVRGMFEFNASLLLAPLLMRAPRGDGHPVLALPGFLASDLSMAPLRRYLRELGYDAHAWQMGRNVGGVSSGCAIEPARSVGSIHATAGRKVSIVGWSLGGVYARDLALQASEMVRWRGDARQVRSRAICAATNATRLYEGMSGEAVERQLRISARPSPAICRCRRPRSIPAPMAS